MNNLATAQGKKDTPSLIDVKGLGRPKGFSRKEEDFQQWSKKTEAFFAGVIKESEMMLEWSAEQPTATCSAANMNPRCQFQIDDRNLHLGDRIRMELRQH